MKNFYDYYRAKPKTKTREHPQPWVFGELRQRYVPKNGYQYYLLNAKGEILIDEKTACAYLGENDRNGTPMFEHDVLLWDHASDDPRGKSTHIHWVGTLCNVLKYKDYIKEGVIVGNTFDHPNII